MTRRLRVSAAAETDVAFAAGWYDTQASGLGIDFIAQVDTVYRRITEYPEMHQVAFGSVRRAIVRRYPYVVVYRVDSSVIDVLGVLPCRAHPQTMKRRISTAPNH